MERWKTVEGYEGMYMVSNTGLVKSLTRTVLNKHGNPQTYPGKLLKPDVLVSNTTSYHRVTLSKGNKTSRFSVHRLVAKAFIPNPDNKPFINHIDNDGTHNNESNIEWVTHSENMVHAQKQGRLFQSQSTGGKKGSRVNLQKQVAKISKLLGTSVGKWLVVDDSRMIRAKKTYLLCRCSCGRQQRIELGRLERNEVSCCKTCAGIQRRNKIKI